MKYYSYSEPNFDDNGKLLREDIVTKSEQEIISEYFEYWYERMCKKFGKEHVDSAYTKQDCIDDWIVIHWAWESE